MITEQHEMFTTKVLMAETSGLSSGPGSHLFNAKYFFASNIIGVAYADIHGRVFEANEAFLNLVGYTHDDFQKGQTDWWELIPQESKEVVETILKEIRQYRMFRPAELQFIRKDGQRVDVLVSGGLEEGSDEATIAFVIDISTRKQFERALIKGESLFRTMADYSTMMVWFLTPDARLHYLNKRVLEYVGVPLEKWAGWETFIHPDDIERTTAVLQEAFAQRGYYHNEQRLRRFDGQYRWFLSTGGPVFSEEGEFLGYVGTGVEIHELKQAQHELLEYAHKLERSNTELEHFAMVASHDLQEPLRKVIIFSDHLKSISKDTLCPEALDDLERIQRASLRMQRLINDLLDLSRINRRGQPFRKVDLRRLTEEALAELSYTYNDIKNRVTVSGELTVDADANQVYQMLLQLLDNALKFHKRDQPSQVQVRLEAHDGNQCRIIVTDTGLGIKAEYYERIFKTFVRLHQGAAYPGTGIGLALVQKILERHNGTITVESEFGEGSTFTVTLPCLQNKLPAD